MLNLIFMLFKSNYIFEPASWGSNIETRRIASPQDVAESYMVYLLISVYLNLNAFHLRGMLLNSIPCAVIVFTVQY